MEIKNIFKKLRPQRETVDNFFAVEITDDTVKSAVWSVIGGQTKVVSVGSSQNWDGKNKETLLEAVDRSISQASEKLSAEPTGVIFGLPESWSDEAGVMAAKKPLLKHVCEELELKPLGFVVTDTALIAYLKIEEGAPANAILLQLGSTDLGVNLVKMGKSLGTQLVGRSEDLAADVEEGLSRYEKIDTLPARMILYNGHTDFEEAKQQLISYSWEDKLPFIHFPKVESLSPDTTIKALALAGGSEVAKSLGLEIKPPEETNPGKLTESPKEVVKKEVLTAASLGFVSDEDIADKSPEPEPEIELEPEPESEPQAEFEPVPESKSEVQIPAVVVPKPKFDFGPIVSRLQLIKDKFFSGKKMPLLAGGLILLLVILTFLYWFIPKATVTLVVAAQTVDEALTVTIDSQAQSLDTQGSVLPGQTTEINVTGSKSIPTTGTAVVGDPAKGEVTIYNATNQTKTFAAGTALLSQNDLSFSLDADTTVASQSAEEKVAGKLASSVAVITAKSIGPDGNLGADTLLSFQQFSDDDYYAKVNSGLSGGTAREVKAVSEKDQEDLIAALTSDLQAKAQEQLQANLGTDKALVPVNSSDALTDQAFNHDEGEEADSLQLEARLNYTGLSYSKGELNLLLQNSIKTKVPDNFQVSESSEINLGTAQATTAKATVPVSFKAKLIPKLDFVVIKDNLKGKRPNLVEEYLAKLPSFVRAEIKLQPNLPSFLKTLPRVAKNIAIDVKIEE